MSIPTPSAEHKDASQGRSCGVGEKKAPHTPEEWRPTKYLGYDVSDQGRVRSNIAWRGKPSRILNQTLNAHGYPSVRVMVEDGKRRRVCVHWMVAAAFLPPRPSPAHEVRHFDGTRANNDAQNLLWGTRKDNADDRARHGRTSHGPSHSAAIKRGLEAANV